jgi:hypothetical protein
MPVTPLTILIPDISGYTDFMSSIEIEHATHLINSFLETIVKEANPDFEVSEIEGDAVLLCKKGGVTSKQEITEQCLKMFNAFHTQRKMMQQLVLCPCGACQGMINLSLKFIAHHGTATEIKVGKFIKASGLDMIIAHRLLKNSIRADEYVLVTKNFLEQVAGSDDHSGLEWQLSQEEYPSIGKVNFEYALLEQLKSVIPDPPKPDFSYHVTESDFAQVFISLPFKEVYMRVIDMPARSHWMHGLHSVTEGADHAYVGSLHTCLFRDFQAQISPMKLVLNNDEVIYAELMTIREMNLELVYEYRFRFIERNECEAICRLYEGKGSQLTNELRYYLSEEMKKSCNRLKEYCEQQVAV